MPVSLHDKKMTANHLLRESDLVELQSVFSSIPGLEKVVLFGSRAKGTAKPGSDVDLAVWCANRNSALSLAGLLNDETAMPYHFDVVFMPGLNDEALRAHIERVGLLLYKAPYSSPPL